MALENDTVEKFVKDVASTFGTPEEMMREIWMWRSSYLKQSGHSSCGTTREAICYRDFVFLPSIHFLQSVPSVILNSIMYPENCEE